MDHQICNGCILYKSERIRSNQKDILKFYCNEVEMKGFFNRNSDKCIKTKKEDK